MSRCNNRVDIYNMQEALNLANAKKDTVVWANIQITIAGYYVFVLKDYKKCYQNTEEVLKPIENKNRWE